jgi:hypothetical protein
MRIRIQNRLLFFYVDLDRNFYFDEDPDPHQSNAILQLPANRPTTPRRASEDQLTLKLPGHCDADPDLASH